MQFHEYTSLRHQVANLGKTPEYRRHAHGMKPEDYRNFVISTAQQELGQEWEKSEGGLAARAKAVSAEQLWVREQRPYYNIWPIAVELAQSVKLDVAFSDIEPTFKSIVMRFALGHEPFNLTAALLCWHDDRVFVSGPMMNKWFSTEHHLSQNDRVEAWLTDRTWRDLTTNAPNSVRDFIVEGSGINLLVRLLVFVGLLSHDEDVITPIILSKDKQRYDEANDPTVRKWLEDRAARRAGRGFDVGRTLQLERERSPHWRNPHLCLFWTGSGRTKPVIKMRSGAIIQRVSMSEVPTGYLGPETDEEDVLAPEKTPRESVSKSRRFEIFKRDGYKCQLCGRSQSDGVALHIDHRIPLAKGGINEDKNLWTLCEDCNLGKSDRDLS